MAESPISLHQGGGNLAQAVLQNAPEGMLIAPVWKRITAYIIDVAMLVLVLELLAQGAFLKGLSSYGLLSEGGKSAAFFVVNWLMFIGGYYLYFKYTGKTIGRSFGQRALRIAIVHDNGSALEDHHWGPRAVGKFIYLIPVIGPLWFGLRDVVRASSEKSEYRTKIDVANHTVAAVDWSLPHETRMKLR